MKKLLLLLSFVAFFVAMANAQVMQKSPEQRAAHMTKALQKRLNLTADQNNQIYSIFLSQAINMDSLKTNPPAGKRAYSSTKKGIVRSANEQVLAVLNDDQRKQFIELEKMKREKHSEKKAAMMDAQN